MARIVISPPARSDLNAIWDYLAVHASPSVADRVLERLSDAIRRAALSPAVYRRRTEFAAAPRRINVYRYSIFFDELFEGDGIYVWRVLHGARDLPKMVRRPRRAPR